MAIRFLTPNLIDTATMSGSTTATGYPTSNVQNPLIARKWRTTGSSAAEWIKATFSGAVAVTACVIIGHDLTAGDSAIVLQWSNNDADWTTAATFTWNAGNMTAFIVSASHQYWRVAFTKSAAAQIRNIGRLFLGVYVEPERGLPFGWTRSKVDLSTTRRSASGAVFSDVRPKFWKVDFEIRHEPIATFSTLSTAVKDLGVGTDLCVCIDASSANGDNTIYGHLAEPWNETESMLNYRSASFSVEEDI